MAVKNLMEDIVRTVMEEVLRNDRSIILSEPEKEDVLAFVLNRVTPRYITSERGMLHGRLDSRYGFQVRSDIFFLLYEGIQIMGRRRSFPATGFNEKEAASLLPHILGQVLESTTFSVIPGVEVVLLAQGKPVAMVDEHWSNPYRVNRATMGYYHFWPSAEGLDVPGGQSVALELLFRHEFFQEHRVPLEVNLVDKMDLATSFLMPLVLLQAREGIALDFLYED